MGSHHFLGPTVNSIYDGARRLGMNQATKILASSSHSSHKPGLMEYKEVGFLISSFLSMGARERFGIPHFTGTGSPHSP